MAEEANKAKQDAAKHLREQFIELCIMVSPPNVQHYEHLRVSRRESAVEEFWRLMRHPKIKHMIIRDNCLYVQVPTVIIQGRMLGEFLIGVNPLEKTYQIKNLTCPLEGDSAYYHHPHIYSETRDGGRICMDQNVEWEILVSVGHIADAVLLLIDALHQADDAGAYPSAQLFNWPYVK